MARFFAYGRAKIYKSYILVYTDYVSVKLDQELRLISCSESSAIDVGVGSALRSTALVWGGILFMHIIAK